MNIFLFNTTWMLFNLYLAVLPVFFSLFLFRMQHKALTFIVGLLWFLYLPNTVYVFTDLHHLIEQWPMVDELGKFILIVQYSLLEVIGLTCFLFAFYPLERILHNLKFHNEKRVYILILINFLMGFAMSLGKFERINSWDVFINPQSILNATIRLFTSFELIGFGILFGVFANFFYFLFRNKVKKLYIKWFN
jgi:uncharacterized membrane protein